MLEHTKRHPISAHALGSILYVTDDHHITYAIPKKVAEKYIVEESEKASSSMMDLFEKLDEKYTRAGALLKGLRAREGLSQVIFAEKIGVTQANLSNMEHGRRAIGKAIAKRIEQVFGTNYRYFLE